MEHFLDSFFRSNVLVIEVLFGVVLLGVILLAVRTFLRPEEKASTTNLESLEDGIKKILDNYSQQTKVTADANETTPKSDDPVMEEMVTQIERLKIQLMQKNEELEQIKANGSVSQEGAPSANLSNDAAEKINALEEKIRDLEAKLSEYAIIEDDIADLSLYKEENAKLKAEIEELKSKLAEAPGSKTAAIDPLAEIESVVEDDIEQEEEATTEGESNGLVDVAAAGDVEEVPLERESNPVNNPDLQGNLGDDDVMAEFEKAIAEQKAMMDGAEKTPIDESINLDKMLNEVSSLPTTESEEAKNALEESLDTEKLLKEATTMENVDSEDLSKFDEFLKKEGA